jgi:hypothetical protein
MSMNLKTLIAVTLLALKDWLQPVCSSNWFNQKNAVLMRYYEGNTAIFCLLGFIV